MKKPLLLAALFGVLAALLTALYFNSIETTYKKGAQKVKVLVAKQYIDQGTVLDELFVEEKLVPKEYLQPKAVQSMKELINAEGKRSFMVIVPIERGEQIITTKLSLLGLETGLSSVIPSDKRAITLVCDAETVSGIMKPGNRVDVIGVMEYQDKSSQMQEAAFTVLQNILVLSVGNTMLGASKPLQKRGAMGENIAAIEQAASGSLPVSLALSPKEAEVIALVSEKGKIRFSLRPLGDERIIEAQGTKIRDIYNDLAVTVSNTTGRHSPAVSESMMRDMQKKQKEVMELLKKYQTTTPH